MINNSLSILRQNIGRFDPAGLAIPGLVLLILAMMVLPLPPLLLDLLFTFNIVVALVIIMIAISTRKPLEFSSFPAILLIATMMRLALNVASTRVILVNGHTGPDAAGQVIASFGEFVIAGNYVVGFIIFVILMVVNFFVVTKGAGRVSEVNARFTLDAMPGKQMSIDADLNAGVIDQETAKKRREDLSQESDFFGSMDGASKFVSGDALAGLLILIINIVGGLAIGLGTHDLPLSEVTRIYVLLTIGDGLVAQIPALFLSLATAIIVTRVTRVTTSESMTEQATSQLANPSALFISAGILAFTTAGVSFLALRKQILENPAPTVASAKAYVVWPDTYMEKGGAMANMQSSVQGRRFCPWQIQGREFGLRCIPYGISAFVRFLINVICYVIFFAAFLTMSAYSATAQQVSHPSEGDPPWDTNFNGWVPQFQVLGLLPLPTEGSKYLHINNSGANTSGTSFHPIGTISDPGFYIIRVDIGNFNNLPFVNIGQIGIHVGGVGASSPGTFPSVGL